MNTTVRFNPVAFQSLTQWLSFTKCWREIILYKALNKDLHQDSRRLAIPLKI